MDRATGRRGASAMSATGRFSSGCKAPPQQPRRLLQIHDDCSCCKLPGYLTPALVPPAPFTLVSLGVRDATKPKSTTGSSRLPCNSTTALGRLRHRSYFVEAKD